MPKIKPAWISANGQMPLIPSCVPEILRTRIVRHRFRQKRDSAVPKSAMKSSSSKHESESHRSTRVTIVSRPEDAGRRNAIQRKKTPAVHNYQATDDEDESKVFVCCLKFKSPPPRFSFILLLNDFTSFDWIFTVFTLIYWINLVSELQHRSFEGCSVSIEFQRYFQDLNLTYFVYCSWITSYCL